MPQFRRLGFRRRVEHGRDVPAPLDLVRDLEMNHRPREASLRRVNDSLSRLSRATAYTGRLSRSRTSLGLTARKPARRVSGTVSESQRWPPGVPLPTVAAVLGHAAIATMANYTTALGVGARGVPAVDVGHSPGFASCRVGERSTVRFRVAPPVGPLLVSDGLQAWFTVDSSPSATWPGPNSGVSEQQTIVALSPPVSPLCTRAVMLVVRGVFPRL